MNTYKNGTMPLAESIETKFETKQVEEDFREWFKSLKTGNIVNRNYPVTQKQACKSTS